MFLACRKPRNPKLDRETLDMPAKQIALLEQVAAANQNVVVVLSNGSVVSVAPWAKNAKAFSNPVCSARPAALRSPM